MATGGVRRKVGILGVPLDLGSNRRGTDMGPSAMRYARLVESLGSLGWEVRDFGNVSFPVMEQLAQGSPRLRYGEVVARVAEEVFQQVGRILEEGYLPVVLGGDHSTSLGTVAAVRRHFPETGLLWVDAHADCNTPQTTPSGNVHGMVLACLLGEGDPRLVQVGGFWPKVSPDEVALVGLREVDPGEREFLKRWGVVAFTMKEVDERGIAAVVWEAIGVAGRGGRIHLSLDLDAVDPQYAPGVGTPVPGGLTYREAHLAMELVAETGQLVSVEVVEGNPILDDHNRTAQLAVELLSSALGKRVL
ncbi:MAG: arginase [Armatimonadetes bacterium]|nr:arginase [Armatimonadota bacterium]MDW8154236.1 arginase [Armatimonadota bacterium]